MSFLYRLTHISTFTGILLLLCPTTHATIFVHVDDVVVPGKSTAIVGVYASSDSGDVISGFNLPLDINNDGFIDGDGDNKSDLPSGFSLGSPSLRNVMYTNTAFDMPQPQIGLIEVDGIPTGSGANVMLSTVRTKLFDLAVDVASGVPPGTRLPLRIIVPISPFQSLFNIAGPNSPVSSAPEQGVPVSGSITVAIPEPSAHFAIFGGVAMISWCSRRRRRQKRIRSNARLCLSH